MRVYVQSVQCKPYHIIFPLTFPQLNFPTGTAILKVQVTKVITVQGAPVTRTVARPVVPSTTTATINKTVVQLAAKVTSTATQFTTTTMTTVALSTTSTTFTTTATATVLSSAVSYDACSPRNTVLANNIWNNGANGASIYSSAAAADQTACCIMCQAATSRDVRGSPTLRLVAV